MPQVVVLDGIAWLLLGLGLGLLIDTNRFSLHAMYRMRLVRTFLGASKAPCDRAPNPFTGFDESDDLPVGHLWPAGRKDTLPSDRDELHPPLHVVNMALNLVAGGNLAWQDRKAESFTVTSLHAGSRNVGYRR